LGLILAVHSKISENDRHVIKHVFKIVFFVVKKGLDAN